MVHPMPPVATFLAQVAVRFARVSAKPALPPADGFWGSAAFLLAGFILLLITLNPHCGAWGEARAVRVLRLEYIKFLCQHTCSMLGM